jgi:hypothetical protein
VSMCGFLSVMEVDSLGDVGGKASLLTMDDLMSSPILILSLFTFKPLPNSGELSLLVPVKRFNSLILMIFTPSTQ